MLLKGKRIFIVEDNPGSKAVMELLFERQGAKTAVERWGTDSVERLREFAPVDVILLDLMLPGHTGFDVFDQIRELPDFAPVPIVAVSAMDVSVAIPKARAKGFAGFIPKPINYDTFPYLIVQILNHQPVWNMR